MRGPPAVALISSWATQFPVRWAMPSLYLLTGRMTTSVHKATAEHARGLADHVVVESPSRTVQSARDQRVLDSCPAGKDVYYWWMRDGGEGIILYFYAASEWEVLDLLGIAELMNG